ncbi:hypothetical protein GCM10020000_20270 [Streptomyces olivoverticillatus]
MNGDGEAVREGGRISTHAVCTAIRDDIVAGVFPPGSRLIEELLARRYGVSRVPVREALRTLASEGFVTTRRHAGACVAEPTEQEAADLLDIRALLEPLGAARAAQRRTEAHLKVLRGLVRLGQERARAGRIGELRPPWATGSTRRSPRPPAAPASPHCSPSSGARSPGCTRPTPPCGPWKRGRRAAPWSTRWPAGTSSGPARWPPPAPSVRPGNSGCGARSVRTACGLRNNP